MFGAWVAWRHGQDIHEHLKRPIGRFRIETTSSKRHSRCLPQRAAPRPLVRIPTDRAFDTFAHSGIDIFGAKQFWRGRLLHLESRSIPAGTAPEPQNGEENRARERTK